MIANTIKMKPVTNDWMVIYTRSRFEKKIDKMLNESGITSFCPVIRSVKKWADRKKLVESPLFPSYVFVKVALSEQLKVKQTPGVINFLSHCGRPVFLNEAEIDNIRSIVANHSDIELVDVRNINIGNRVKIKDGLLHNYQGVVSQIMGKAILMTIEQLNCVITVKVDLDQVSLNVAS